MSVCLSAKCLTCSLTAVWTWMDECNKSVLFAPSLLTAPVARSPPGMCPPPYSARNAAAAALRVDCSKDVGREVHFKSHNMLFKIFANNYNR